MTCHAHHLQRVAPPYRARGGGSWVAFRPEIVACIALASFVLGVLVPYPSRAEDLRLLGISVRARYGGERVLGDVAPEAFREYDVAASIGLPWQRDAESGWQIGTRLLAAAGALQGAGKTALVVSLIPVLAIARQDGWLTFDLGAGGALLSEHRFGRQDYGGPFQFALTFGLGVPVYGRFGVGYRFLHYSDAGTYGGNTTGADFHMVELSYRF